MGQLYLKERASEAGEVLAALWLAHREIVGEWRPLARYLNSLVNPLELLRGGMGVLASGPLTLLNGYRDAISSLVEMGSILPTGPAKRWDEERMWVEENEPLVALVLPYSDALAVGRDQALASWLVAQSVEAHRVR